MSVEQLGKESYQKIIRKDYKEAVIILNTAIEKFPADRRFYTNRCHCYIKLNDINSAFNDAMHLTKEYPDYSKGFLLLGEIVYLQHDYKHAQGIFEILNCMLPDCDEVQDRLLDCQLRQCNVQDRMKHLQITLSEDEEAFLIKSLNDVHKSAKPLKKESNCGIDPRTDPNNPKKSTALYVSNIHASIKTKELQDMFSKFGKPQVVTFPDKNFVFVNFTHPNEAANALKECQGKILGGLKLVVRYSDKSLKK